MGGDAMFGGARTRRRLTALAACGLGLLTACGGGGAEAAKQSSTLEQQVALDEDGIKARQSRAENLMRDCMKAQGFDYVPVDPAAQQEALVGSAGMSKDDFEKQFGYGITTLYEQRLEHAVGGPNRAIRDALGESERKAYDHALHGDDPTATFADALDSGDFSRLGGCIKQSTDQVFGGPDVLQSLQTKLDELDERMLADSRMVEAVSKWSACMSSAGYSPLEQPEDVDAVLKGKLEAIVGSAKDGITGAADYDGAALAALQREEVAMVAADKTCEKQHITAVEDKVAEEYESAFREQNAALLAKVPAK